MFKKLLGRHAEDLAARFLKRSGFKIVERNFSCRLGEIDIIAKDGQELVFVEVRSTSSSFMDPLESITYFKIERLRKLALVWLGLNNIEEYNIRFDVVAVVFKNNLGGAVINHITNAF